MKTFHQLIGGCRATTDAKQPQLLTSDLLTQILLVLVEIRDELAVQRPKKNDFWPIDGNGGSGNDVHPPVLPS